MPDCSVLRPVVVNCWDVTSRVGVLSNDCSVFLELISEASVTEAVLLESSNSLLVVSVVWLSVTVEGYSSCDVAYIVERIVESDSEASDRVVDSISSAVILGGDVSNRLFVVDVVSVSVIGSLVTKLVVICSLVCVA